MILRSPTENENEDLVMPAWMVGIRVRRMRSETSMSAWISALHAGMTRSRVLLKLTETPAYFQSDTKDKKFRMKKLCPALRALHDLRGQSASLIRKSTEHRYA
jgi:hypothetical protein